MSKWVFLSFSVGLILGATFMACATTPSPLMVHTIKGPNNERCYSEADDTAMRIRERTYAACCEGKK